uniref:Hemerythrin n=1 Tax=Phascolosoma agassizii TaxID=360543 RepID=A0A1S6QD32_9ANNE|nr:hemerythrin [Phascolosoma agassizii]
MGYEIPEPYIWDESFMVFYTDLDAEHKKLFEACFDCSKDKDSQENVDKFCEVTEDHFTNEEVYMMRALYPAFLPHKKMHDDFLMRLLELKAPISDQDVFFAKDWLVNHIKTTDFKYIGKIDKIAKGVVD